MLSMAKAGTSTATTPGGAKTIVIAAPKGSSGGLTGTPHKIITSVPKIAGQGNTQFIVVSPQSSVGGAHTITSGGFHIHHSIFIHVIIVDRITVTGLSKRQKLQGAITLLLVLSIFMQKEYMF